MRKIIAATALIAAAIAAPLALPTAASAQGFGVEVGPGGARVGVRDRDWDDRRTVIRRERDYDDRRVVVRERGPDVVYRRGGGDCRIVIERRTNRWGERVVRRTRVCD